MAIFQILTKIEDGKKIAINHERIAEFEDIDGYTLITTIDDVRVEVRESIDDIFNDSSTPTRNRDKKTPFIPIKLSSN